MFGAPVKEGYHVNSRISGKRCSDNSFYWRIVCASQLSFPRDFDYSGFGDLLTVECGSVLPTTQKERLL